MPRKILVLFSALISVAANAQPVVFSPYADMTINTHWDSQYQDMEPADLVKISVLSSVKNFHLAFITDAGNCNAAWGAQSSYSLNDKWGKHLTDRMQAAGIINTVSFGGASGNDISLACNDAQLVDIYENTIKTYKPIGLDFDIENGTANVPKIMSALVKVQNEYPDIKLSFTLPVLPEGLTAEGQGVVVQAQKAGLKYKVNIMAMDYGPAYNKDMGDYTIQAATSLFNFIKSIYSNKTAAECWAMIEVTPMIGVNDVASEQFTLANATAVREFAQQYQIGGLSMWSLSRDNPCADKWASPICSGNNLQSVPYEFSSHFINK